jgi:hypothetical protein
LAAPFLFVISHTPDSQEYVAIVATAAEKPPLSPPDTLKSETNTSRVTPDFYENQAINTKRPLGCLIHQPKGRLSLSYLYWV